MFKELKEASVALDNIDLPHPAPAKRSVGNISDINISPEVWRLIRAALVFLKWWLSGKKKDKCVAVIAFIEGFIPKQ